MLVREIEVIKRPLQQVAEFIRVISRLKVNFFTGNLERKNDTACRVSFDLELLGIVERGHCLYPFQFA